jgi:hypothetical protein
MEMNDNTILRIKVPAHLYEAVKAQLTLKEAKGKHNLGAGMEIVKEKKATSDKPKVSAPKKAAAPKNAEAPKEEAKVPKDGHKKMGIEELKTLAELLQAEIAKLEEKKEEKAPVEEEKEKMEEVKDKVEEKKEEMEESKWGREEYMDEPDYDEKRQRFVRYQPRKTFRPKYVPKGQATMTQGDVGYSSFTKPDADKN